MKRKSVNERFWLNVKITPKCWIWLGKLCDGYGRIKVNGKSVKAHRFSFKLTFGDFPETFHVLHKCDNRACVNPNHLFLGTDEDNIIDKVRKGRQAKGERISLAKLTKKEVLSIRSSNLSAIEAGIKWKVSDTTIRRIRTRKIWKHLD